MSEVYEKQRQIARATEQLQQRKHANERLKRNDCSGRVMSN